MVFHYPAAAPVRLTPALFIIVQTEQTGVPEPRENRFAIVTVLQHP